MFGEYDGLFKGADGKFQFLEGSWADYSSENPFHYVEEFQHALSICLNARYMNKVTVQAHEDGKTEQVHFDAKLMYVKMRWICTYEDFHDNMGEGFEKVLEGMCRKFDDAKVIVEPVFNKVKYWDGVFDHTAPIEITSIPLSGSFQKLKDCGGVGFVSEALNCGISIKPIGHEDVIAALRKMEKAAAKSANAMTSMHLKSKAFEDNLQKLKMKIVPTFEYATGGYVSGEVSYTVNTNKVGYGDSGLIIKESFPEIDTLVNSPCTCGLGTDRIYNIILHLNDHPGHGGKSVNGAIEWAEGPWTREMIADWLETLDVKLELKEN